MLCIRIVSGLVVWLMLYISDFFIQGEGYSLQELSKNQTHFLVCPPPLTTEC